MEIRASWVLLQASSYGRDSSCSEYCPLEWYLLGFIHSGSETTVHRCLNNV